MSIDLATLNRFASAWGWPPLKRLEDAIPVLDELIVWWESRISDDLFLQINVQTRVENGFFACVYAVNYRLCSGWYPFIANQNDSANFAEAERLRAPLHFDRFATGKSRAAYRKEYPWAIGFAWGKDVPLVTSEDVCCNGSVEPRSLLRLR